MTKRRVGTVCPASSSEIVNENRRWPGITRSSKILKKKKCFDGKDQNIFNEPCCGGMLVLATEG